MRLKLALLAIVLLVPAVALSLDAFPGAVGVGKNTVGGRGGAVIHVTNLNDSGTGSLREALATTGARTVVFDVSGNIDLTSILTVTEPYVTIAGQTSPGGIAVSGKQFNVATHDVIIRHMRFRAGGHRYDGNDSDGDSFSVWGKNWNGGIDVYNIMIDHCSFTWGVDETMSVTGGAENVTIQNSMIAGGLWYSKLGTGNHSKGLMVSGKNNYDTEVSVYKNYIAHNYDRSPLISNPDADNTSMLVDYVNNVSYNWHSGLRPSGGGDAHINWIANYMKEGPDSARADFFMQQEYEPAAGTEPLFYVLDNIGTGRNIGDSQWLVSENYTSVLLTNAYQQATRWTMTEPLPYETMTSTLASSIVTDAGATVPIRDSVDTAYIDSFDAGTNEMEDGAGDKSYPSDWPTYSTANDNPIDTDSDGMPDTWETANGTNPSIADDDTVISSGDYAGYTNIEWYLSDLAGDTTTTPTTTRYYLDADADGYSPGTYQDAETDPGPTWYTAAELTALTVDCDDSSASVHPGVTEICGNGIDEDCSGGDQLCSGASFTGAGSVNYTGAGSVKFQ